MNNLEKLQTIKPYYLINGVLTKDSPQLNLLWESLLPYFNGIENGISKIKFKFIVAKEHLNKIPDGEKYGYRKIVFSKKEMIGFSWTIGVFSCNITLNEKSKKMFVVSDTGERGNEGFRCYFENKNKALSYLIALLRSMKK